MLQCTVSDPRRSKYLFKSCDGVSGPLIIKIRLESEPVIINAKLSKCRSLAAIVGSSAVLWLAMLEIGKVAVSHL